MWILSYVNRVLSFLTTYVDCHSCLDSLYLSCLTLFRMAYRFLLCVYTTSWPKKIKMLKNGWKSQKLQKYPLSGQILIFVALVFCKHPYFHGTYWFYIRICEVMLGLFRKFWNFSEEPLRFFKLTPHDLIYHNIFIVESVQGILIQLKLT